MVCELVDAMFRYLVYVCMFACLYRTCVLWFATETDLLTIVLSDDISLSFDCEKEEDAFAKYIQISKSYAWEQVYQWNRTEIENANHNISTLFGTDDTTITLSNDDLFVLNGFFESNYSLINVNFDSGTLTEGNYYLFDVSMIISLDSTATKTFSDYVGIYVKPTAVGKIYLNVEISEYIGNTTEYNYNLMNYFSFPINNLTEIANRYQISLNCINSNCQQSNAFSIYTTTNNELFLNINGTKLASFTRNALNNTKFRFSITVNDTIYFDELNPVTIEFNFIIINENDLGVTLAINSDTSISDSTRFNSNSKLVLKGSVTLNGIDINDLTDLFTNIYNINIEYEWKDLNNMLNFSQNFITTYKNYLVIDGRSLTDYQRQAYLAPNTQFNIAMTAKAVSTSTDNTTTIYVNSGSGNIALEVNDVPSNGSCGLFVNDTKYDPTSIDTIIYALKTIVTIDCDINGYSDWYDQDSPPLYFSFYLFDGLSKVLIRSPSFESHYSFQVGIGNYTIYCEVSDNLGATRIVSQTFTSVLSTKFENLDIDEQIDNIAIYLNNSFYSAAEVGDTSEMAMAVVNTISLIEYIGTSDDNDTIEEELTEIRGDMITAVIGTFEELPINEDNIETEAQLISVIVNTPRQIDGDTGKAAYSRIGELMDNSVNISDTGGSMNDNTANAIADCIVDLSESLAIKINASVNNYTDYSTSDVAQLTTIMLDVLMVDKVQGSVPGEVGYQYTSDDVEINVLRLESSGNINGSINSCASDYLEFDQVGTVVNDNLNGTNEDSFDCLFSQTSSVIWDNINGEKIYSNVISLDFTNSVDNRTFNRQEIVNSVLNSSNTTTRRRLSDDLEIAEETLSKLNISELDVCNVFVFIMYHNDDANFTNWLDINIPSDIAFENGETANITINLPICRYYDTINEEWSSDGCWAVSSNATMTKCACVHLSSFTISGDDFVPSINTIDLTAIRALSFKNLEKHPNAIIISSCLIFIFWMLILCLPRDNDKPMAAQLRPWSQLQQRKWNKFMVYKQNRILISNKNICIKLFEWFWIYLKNSHSILSVCMRDYGTNWSGPQRLFCFLASVVTLAAVNAMYYGKTSYTESFGSMINACYASMSGSVVPVLLSFLFGYHTPAMATRQPQAGIWEMLMRKCNCCNCKNTNDNNNDDDMDAIEIDEKQIEFDILGLLAHNDLKTINKICRTNKTENLMLKRRVTKTDELFNQEQLQYHFRTNGTNNTNNKNNIDIVQMTMNQEKSNSLRFMIDNLLIKQDEFSQNVTQTKTQRATHGLFGVGQNDTVRNSNINVNGSNNTKNNFEQNIEIDDGMHMGSTSGGMRRASTKREATELHYRALKASVMESNQMLVPVKIQRDNNANIKDDDDKIQFEIRQLTPEGYKTQKHDQITTLVNVLFTLTC